MSPTTVVFRKEMTELLRDKRIRNTAIIMPAVLVYGVLYMFGFLGGIGEKQNQKIHVIEATNSFTTQLKEDKVQVFEVPTKAQAEEMIRSGKASLVLQFQPDFDARVSSGSPTAIQAYFDPQSTPAKIALNTVQQELAKLNAGVAIRVLKAHDVDPKALAPISLKSNEVKVGSNNVSELLLSMLPYFIVIWAFYGGMGTAGDLVAGEKEKQTLETLLIAPVGRTQIAFGKFFALCSICLISSLSALLGFIVAGLGGMKIFEHGIGIGLPAFVTILLVLLPTVAFFASILLAISTYAKNAREAQSYLAMVSFVVILPAIFGQFIGFTDLASNWWIRLIPVLNTSLAVREALQGKTSPIGVVITIAVGAILAVIAIRIAVRLFKREQVLARI